MYLLQLKGFQNMKLSSVMKHESALLGFAAGVMLLLAAAEPLSRGVLPPRSEKPPKAEIYQSQPIPPPVQYHPPHIVKVWITEYRGKAYRTIQLPRCEHLEAVLTYEPSGETLRQAQERMGGVAASTAGFCHPTSYSLADFIQRQGRQLTNARTGRWMFVIFEDGSTDLSGNYMLIKKKAGVTAIALGQRLVPLERDGFSRSFMNRHTDRMAIGMRKHFIYIVSGKSDIWTLSRFMDEVLECKVAINCDGGHIVRGKSPTHIVFRWRTNGNGS